MALIQMGSSLLIALLPGILPQCPGEVRNWAILPLLLSSLKSFRACEISAALGLGKMEDHCVRISFTGSLSTQFYGFFFVVCLF